MEKTKSYLKNSTYLSGNEINKNGIPIRNNTSTVFFSYLAACLLVGREDRSQRGRPMSSI
jgi:hypothetical protein